MIFNFNANQVAEKTKKKEKGKSEIPGDRKSVMLIPFLYFSSATQGTKHRHAGLRGLCVKIFFNGMFDLSRLEAKVEYGTDIMI